MCGTSAQSTDFAIFGVRVDSFTLPTLFLAFRKRGPNANTAGKDEATEWGVSAGKGGEMPAVEGGAASRAA